MVSIHRVGLRSPARDRPNFNAVRLPSGATSGTRPTRECGGSEILRSFRRLRAVTPCTWYWVVSCFPRAAALACHAVVSAVSLQLRAFINASNPDPTLNYHSLCFKAADVQPSRLISGTKRLHVLSKTQHPVVSNPLSCTLVLG